MTDGISKDEWVHLLGVDIEWVDRLMADLQGLQAWLGGFSPEFWQRIAGVGETSSTQLPTTAADVYWAIYDADPGVLRSVETVVLVQRYLSGKREEALERVAHFTAADVPEASDPLSLTERERHIVRAYFLAAFFPEKLTYYLLFDRAERVGYHVYRVAEPIPASESDHSVEGDHSEGELPRWSEDTDGYEGLLSEGLQHGGGGPGGWLRDVWPALCREVNVKTVEETLTYVFDRRNAARCLGVVYDSEELYVFAVVAGRRAGVRSPGGVQQVVRGQWLIIRMQVDGALHLHGLGETAARIAESLLYQGLGVTVQIRRERPTTPDRIVRNWLAKLLSGTAAKNGSRGLSISVEGVRLHSGAENPTITLEGDILLWVGGLHERSGREGLQQRRLLGLPERGDRLPEQGTHGDVVAWLVSRVERVDLRIDDAEGMLQGAFTVWVVPAEDGNACRVTYRAYGAGTDERDSFITWLQGQGIRCVPR